MRGWLSREDGVKAAVIAGAAKLCGDPRIAQDPRHAGQRFQVIGPCAFWSDQQTYKIDRYAVEGAKVDGLRKPGEKAEDRLRVRELAMRNCNALAYPRRAEPLPLEQSVEDFPRLQTGNQPGPVAKFHEDVFLCRALERVDNRLGGDQFAKQHSQNQSGPFKQWIRRPLAGGRERPHPLRLLLPAWIDPADISIGAAIYNIRAAIGSMTKNNDLSVR